MAAAVSTSSALIVAKMSTCVCASDACVTDAVAKPLPVLTAIVSWMFCDVKKLEKRKRTLGSRSLDRLRSGVCAMRLRTSGYCRPAWMRLRAMSVPMGGAPAVSKNTLVMYGAVNGAVLSPNACASAYSLRCAARNSVMLPAMDARDAASSDAATGSKPLAA